MRSFMLVATALSFALAVVAIAQPSKSPVPAAVPAHVPGLESRFIDTTADPCTDFFKYACGNFAKYYPIPNDLSAYSSGAIVFEHNEAVLHTMLEKVAAPTASRSASEQKIGDFYAACMDTATIDRKGMQAFHDELAKIDAVNTKADLAPLIGHYQVTNVAAFVGVGEQ